jgi:hypothetical protein
MTGTKPSAAMIFLSDAKSFSESIEGQVSGGESPVVW